MDLLTTAEFARELNVHPMTVYRKLKQGKIKGYKIDGNDWRIPKTELYKLLREPEVTNNNK